MHHDRSRVNIKLEDTAYHGTIQDLSLSGAAPPDVRPAIGTMVWLGNTRGRVIRHFEDGVAIEFLIQQTHDSQRIYRSEHLGRAFLPLTYLELAALVRSPREDTG